MASISDWFVIFIQMFFVVIAALIIIPIFIIAFFIVTDKADPKCKRLEGTHRPWIK